MHATLYGPERRLDDARDLLVAEAARAKVIELAQRGRELTYDRYYRAYRKADGTLRRGCVDDVWAYPRFADLAAPDQQERLRTIGGLLVPNRAFSSYVPLDVIEEKFRVPLVGGSGKRDNWSILGSKRTYGRLEQGQEFTYKNWIEAVRAGRTFVSNGPLLFFTVDGQDSGAVIKLPAGGGTVRVRAEAKSLTLFDRVEIVANGVVIGQADAHGSPAEAVVELEVPMTAPGWLAARCVGPYDNEGSMDWVGAQVSPVYVEVEGMTAAVDAAALAPFFTALDDMRAWVATEANCPTDAQRERLAAVFETARLALTRRLR